MLSEDPAQLPAVLQGGPIHTGLAGLTSCPELVIWPLPLAPETSGSPESLGGDPLPRLHSLTRHTLYGLQEWLAHPEAAASRLVILTRHAVSTGVADRAPDLAHAAAWALIHSAQSEHPERIVVLDTDDSEATEQALLATLARWPAGEPQLAMRHGSAYLPRLTRARAVTPPPPPWCSIRTGRCWSPGAPEPWAGFSPSIWSPPTGFGICCWSLAAVRPLRELPNCRSGYVGWAPRSRSAPAISATLTSWARCCRPFLPSTG